MRNFLAHSSERFGLTGHLRKLVVAYLVVKVVAWPVIAWAAVNGCR
jgi:hypothetical protein